MTHFVTLGKIVRAATQEEAVFLFARRKEMGISGVIFRPEINIPPWTPEEKIRLSKSSHSFYPFDPAKDSLYSPSHEWKKIAGKLILDFVSLSSKFNASSLIRPTRFAYDDDICEEIHRDVSAKGGWLHFHLSGNGMQCATPSGDKPVQLRTTGADGEKIYAPDFNRLVMHERTIEILTLQEGEAIAFDDNMIHLSGAGQRFRVIAFG